MFGLDQSVANLSDGTTLLIVILVAIVLGLRHATDPDHLAAVSTLIASKREQTARHAARLGFSWGIGHATSLFVFGLPILLFKAYLPGRLQQGAETVIGLIIIGLAVWLLVRWKRGFAHLHDHTHLNAHDDHRGHGHTHAPKSRTPWQAYGIGVIHGIGGSAGVGVLLLTTIQSRVVAVIALALFSFFTAVSMALLSMGFGMTLARPRVQRSFNRLAPVLGVASLAFGVWYSLGALGVAPYSF
jgi:ABC-type nickel/cobalt efflux system permease component RcnA